MRGRRQADRDPLRPSHQLLRDPDEFVHHLKPEATTRPACHHTATRDPGCCLLLLPLDKRTHYHLVIEAKAVKLAPSMQWLNGVYAQGFNKRYERRGHLFGARFEARVVRDERHLLAATQYVLNNPVRAGLCAQASDWPGSYAAPEVGGQSAGWPRRRSRRGRRCARARATRRASRRAARSRRRRPP